jgi:hypothetical protein
VLAFGETVIALTVIGLDAISSNVLAEEGRRTLSRTTVFANH